MVWLETQELGEVPEGLSLSAQGLLEEGLFEEGQSVSRVEPYSWPSF